MNWQHWQFRWGLNITLALLIGALVFVAIPTGYSKWVKSEDARRGQ